MEIWKKAQIENAVFYEYKELNHLFIDGAAWLADLAFEEDHVSKDLIKDLTEWIK